MTAAPATDPDAWFRLPVLVGGMVTLRPMAREDADGYLAAAGTGPMAEEVFRWLNPPPGSTQRAPVDLADARRHVEQALDSASRSERFAFTQLDTGSGEVIGTTSFYDVLPALRTIAIGHTWLGRDWWRTGHNTESKLLLLEHAFGTLGAVRVVWHTDVFNERSQAAIARLGATREGLLRKHRIRFEGTWRDTVQYSMTDDDWPEVQARLRTRLHAG